MRYNTRLVKRMWLLMHFLGSKALLFCAWPYLFYPQIYILFIQQSYALDNYLVLILQQLHDSLTVQNFTLQNELLRRKGKFVIGPDINLKTKLIAWLHSSPKGGHSSREITLTRVRGLFYWKGLTKDVSHFVRSCVTCQASKYDTSAKPGKLQPLPIPTEVC